MLSNIIRKEHEWWSILLAVGSRGNKLYNFTPLTIISLTQIQEAEQASLSVKRSGAMTSLRILKVLFFLSAWLSYLPRVDAAEFAPCTHSFACYFFPLSEIGGGYQVDNAGPAKMGIEVGTPDFPLIFWGRSPQIHFLVQESIPDKLAKEIVGKFMESLKDLKLYDSLPQIPELAIASVEMSKKLYNLQKKDESNSDIDLGRSRYLKHNIYFFPNVTRYKKVSELDFLELNLKRDFLKKPPGQNIFITISEFDPSVEFTGDKDIHPTYTDNTYIDYPKKIISAFSKEPYIAETRLTHYVRNKTSAFVQCDTRVIVNALYREIVGMIMHIHVRSQEWFANNKTLDTAQGCVPLIFALPVPYPYASKALETITEKDSSYFNSPLLATPRVKDLISQ